MRRADTPSSRQMRRVIIALLPVTTFALSAVPYFDTANRLQRSASPPDGIEPRYIPVYRGELCVAPVGNDGGCACEPVLFDSAAAAEWTDDTDAFTTWLGTAEEGALADLAPADKVPGFYMLDLSHLPEAPSLGEGRWAPLRAARGPGGGEQAILGGSSARVQSDDEVALLSTARGLSLWHQSVKFCSTCGAKTKPVRDGRNRQCVDPACGTRFRPRLDPSVIVLVTRGEQCLLGRKKAWPEGRYSTLAGFTEFGESLEECVLREMKEEAGVICDRKTLTFVGSQSWLFPRSLMVGYIVATADDELQVEEEELADVHAPHACIHTCISDVYGMCMACTGGGGGARGRAVV